MAKPLILYRSFLRSASAVIADPGTETGFSIDSLKDLKAYTLWKSNGTAAPVNLDVDLGASPEAADYLMLVNHNLYTLGATIQVLADTFTPPTTVRMAATTPTEDTVSVLAFTQTAALQYWRFVINHAAPPFASAPYLGELFCGLKTELPHFLAPAFDPFFRQVAVQGGARSRGGHALAVTLRGQTHRGEITFGDAGASRAEYTATLNAFIDGHALLRRPFGFVLDTADSDFSVARYVKVPDESDVSRMAVGGSWQNLALTIPVEEAFVEPAV